MNRTTKITITLVVAVIIMILGLKYVSKHEIKNNSVAENQSGKTTSISIINNEITEKYFTSKVSTINGSGVLVENANKYIQDTLNEFRNMANKDVPDILAKWGADSPIAKYSIYLEVGQVEGAKAASII